jgi:hypothetical protein
MPSTFTLTWQSEPTAIGCASGRCEALNRLLRPIKAVRLTTEAKAVVNAETPAQEFTRAGA